MSPKRFTWLNVSFGANPDWRGRACGRGGGLSMACGLPSVKDRVDENMAKGEGRRGNNSPSSVGLWDAKSAG